MKNPKAYRYSLQYAPGYFLFTTANFNSQPWLADRLTDIDRSVDLGWRIGQPRLTIQ